uniref:Heat shock 70 kDa protein 13 n=1 Tax=Strigamia maritima TaxID=126957 RepID=T1J6P4_STRMM
MGYAFTILGTSILAVLLAGYLAQHYLPPPTPKIVGLDLGTTFSCVAVYQAVTGQVRVIENGYEKKTIPSIIAYTNDEILVGYDALQQAEKNANCTFYDAKRFIGRRFSGDELKKESARYQFKMIEKGGMVSFVAGNEQNITLLPPELVGAHILRKLVESAEKNLSVSITKAVMAVPAEFDEMQRAYTKLAAKLAGIEVVRIINEPTAAALAYGLHKKQNISNVLVVDIGGGTSDISLLNIQGGMFLTQSMAGNNHLGGQDFNQRLFNHLLSIIENKYNKQLTNSEDLQTLRLTVETIKINLTIDHSVEINIPLPSINQMFQYNVTRHKFEEINRDLFDKVLLLFDAVLKAVEMSPVEVDEIVLVGGSTRIPLVRTIIEGYFGKKPNVGIDPELAVAYGVAIQAGIIGGAWPLQVSAIEIPVKLRKIRVE